MSKSLFDRRKGRLFKPKMRNSNRNSQQYLARQRSKDILFKDFKDTNIQSTASFRYGDKSGIVSTQEVNIDYSKFENHTFFHSAVAKTNEAFDLIINKYPFDGSNKEIEVFEDSLTGYEDYVLDRFPKNVGYLVFTGTQKSETITNGTYLTVKDSAGLSYSSLSKNKSGKTIIDPGKNPLMIQFYIKIPTRANDNQIILQKSSSLANNFTIALSQSTSTTKCNLLFGITSGSYYLYAESSIDKGRFIHVSSFYDPEDDQRIKIVQFDDSFSNTSTKRKLAASSSGKNIFDNLKYFGSNLDIGKGSAARLNNSVFTPQQSFSGSIDDIRIYHTVHRDDIIDNKRNRSVSGDDQLALYYKFNEPYGSYEGNHIVLDSSGNSLNSDIKNFNYTINRLTGSDVPVLSEKLNDSPVLFPKFDKVISLNTDLISSGSDYDEVNPNLITRLVPNHYFHQGNNLENFCEILGNISGSFGKLVRPRSYTDTPTSAQLLVIFLLTWAKYFDELKIFVDNFSLLQHVKYEDVDTVSDKHLFDLGKKLGITLPKIFENATNVQLFSGIDFQNKPAKSTKTLLQIQYLIWRKILTDVPNIRLTKGTLDSIRSVFRSSGIEPENIFHFREYGGSKSLSLEGSTEIKRDIINFLNFSGSAGQKNQAVNDIGRSSAAPYMISPYLSTSRIEPGKPKIRGTFVNKKASRIHGLSNNTSDGLMTSGSFTYRANYLFSPSNATHDNLQSLARIHVTGSSAPSSTQGCVANLIADISTNKLTLYVSDSPSNTKIDSLYLTGVNITDNNPWSVSFGRISSEELSSNLTSSYFLRAARTTAGKVMELYSTSSLFGEVADSVFNNISVRNTLGTFLAYGSQSFKNKTKFINRGTTDQRTTYFSGKVSYINFWSKDNSLEEFKAYAKNPNSVGTRYPLEDYNFNTNESGSFSRLRIQTSGKQALTSSNTLGNFNFFDFTQNNLNLSGSNFEISKAIMDPVYVMYEILSDRFDLNSSREKIRIRSMQDLSLMDRHEYASTTPTYEVLPSEEVFDDTRFSIDMSVMKGLNENIMTMFSTFDTLDDALGMPNIIFADRYQDLINFRKLYFNNVLSQINLGKYRELFKWIDNSFTDLVYSLVPKTTNFLGINFIYESHVLERHRMQYLFDEIYLKALPRDPARGDLLLSQYVAKLCKY
jgi:hypothetical protein